MISTLTYGTTFALGAMHALEPGHGKSFIASYMVGEKLRLKSMAAMLGTLLVSHFLLLTVLAIIIKLLFAGVASETLTDITSWVAPFIIFGFGLYLFIKYRKHDHLDDDCNCSTHSHDHSHDHDHDDQGHEHTHTPAKPHDETHSKNPALVGLITGLVPCPSVAAPVVLAATAGFSNVLVTIGLYVVGMILVLSGIVALFFFARNIMNDRISKISQTVNLHVLSAVMIMLVGVVYFSLNFLPHAHDHLHVH